MPVATTKTQSLRVNLTPKRRRTLESIRRRFELRTDRIAFDFILEQVDALARKRLFPAVRTLEAVIRAGVELEPARKPLAAIPDRGITSLRMSNEGIDLVDALHERFGMESKKDTIDHILREVEELDRVGLFPANVVIDLLKPESED